MRRFFLSYCIFEKTYFFAKRAESSMSMEQSNKMSRRNALVGTLGVALGGSLLTSIGYADEKSADSEDQVWKYTKLCPKKVGQRVHDSFGTKGCMYGALKGAILEYAQAIESTDAAKAAAARSFPFVGMQAGRAGCGKLKSLCGGVNGAAIFMALFVDKTPDLTALIQKLGDYAKETALPEFKPENDPYENFPTAVAHGVTCKEMGGAWMAAASEDFKKVVGERCKRHTASIMAKAVELLNDYFKEA